jgi:hypothetical protein
MLSQSSSVIATEVKREVLEPLMNALDEEDKALGLGSELAAEVSMFLDSNKRYFGHGLPLKTLKKKLNDKRRELGKSMKRKLSSQGISGRQV